MVIHPDAVDILIERMKAAGDGPVETDVQWAGPTCYGREVYEVPSEIIGDVRMVDLGAVADDVFAPKATDRATVGVRLARDDERVNAWRNESPGNLRAHFRTMRFASLSR